MILHVPDASGLTLVTIPRISTFILNKPAPANFVADSSFLF